MAKKDLKRSTKVEEEAEERDEEEEEGHESDEEDDDEEEEEEAAAAPVRAGAAERRARMRERRFTAPAVEDRGHPGHDDVHPHTHDADDDEIDTSNDPTWWVPHAVLGALVLVGILGFFGAFNKVAEKLGYKGFANLTAPAETAAPARAPEPTPPPRPAQPMPRPGDQAQGEKFGAKHLLVMYKGSMRAPENITRTKEEAKARAEEALKKARGGAKFEDLVKEYSDEPGAAQRGGDLGTFQKGRMVPAFQDGVEKTKVGGVSDLVETPFGYHVILRTQ